MPIPSPVFYPPFNITRISHTVLTIRDPARSRDFYMEVYGLVVTEEDGDVVYLRGIEEACHHRLVLKRTDAEPVCEAVGFVSDGGRTRKSPSNSSLPRTSRQVGLKRPIKAGRSGFPTPAGSRWNSAPAWTASIAPIRITTRTKEPAVCASIICSSTQPTL